VTVLLDSGILYAYYDRSDRWHPAAAALVEAELGGLLLPAPVVPEVDHLLGVRLGREARRLFYQGLVEASYLMVDLPQDRIGRIVEIAGQFADLELGFVDCAVVALAESLEVQRVATTDRRHFEPLARAFGLELLPTAPGAPG
jgi:predicted nucleic acid-binding protein